jgi:hypothetical protein
MPSLTEEAEEQAEKQIASLRLEQVLDVFKNRRRKAVWLFSRAKLLTRISLTVDEKLRYASVLFAYLALGMASC